MIHKGNIANIKITPADVVDCVIGGSPCQGLSVAGKRLGLSDERSGLFMEQIRIIKEMREVDKRSGRSGINVRPRWGVWENVPGALSSGTPKGEDFRIVLEEFIKIADPTATVPRPARGGWNNSGCIVGDGYSLAWRIMDARYHGVPQRRRRITLIVDFAGDSASEVLFNEEGMRWDFETSQRAWKRASGHAERCSVGSSGEGFGDNLFGCLNPRDPESKRIFGVGGHSQARCLDTSGGNPVCNQGGNVVCHEVCAFSQNQREEVRELGEIAGSVSSQTGTHQQTYVVAAFMGGQEEKAGVLGCKDKETTTLKSTPGGSNAVPDVVYAIEGNGQRPSHKGDGWSEEQVGYTLNSIERHGVAYAIDGNVCDRVSKKNGCGYSENVSPTLNTQDRHAVVCDARGNGDGATCCTITGDHCNRVTDYTPIAICETVGALCARDSKGVGTQFVDENKVIVQPFDKQRIGQYSIGEKSSTLSARDYKDASDLICTKTDNKYIVRRLTPLECSRLQGLQDDWCVVPPQETVSDEDLAFWKPLWDEWMQINGKKTKTENQITKWLMSEVSESAQYQMYGNGIALPQWVWTLGRIIETYGEHKPTMASLFDGTGSFPLIWNSILGGAYTVWSSEVNPDAVRVSKYRMQERGW